MYCNFKIETKRLVIRAIEYGDNVNIFNYPVDRRNIPSRRIPESLGGVVKEEYEKENRSGKILDLVCYHII